MQQAAPIYFGFTKWKDGVGGVWPDVFVIGFDPASKIFLPDSINQQTAVLERRDTVLVDSATRPMFGPLTTGRVVEIDTRKVTLGGQYDLGTGFMGLGVVLASAQNFARLFPGRGLNIVNLGAIELKPGVEPEGAASDLRKAIGAGAKIFTRKELEADETAYWTTRTSVGIIFGSGLLISFIVGVMIVYQIVSTQVSRQLPQFATMKAIGYPDRSLVGTVGAMSLLIVMAGFIPALGAALGLYSVIRAGDPAAGRDERDTPRRGVHRRSRHGLGLGAAFGRQPAPRRPGRCVLGKTVEPVEMHRPLDGGLAAGNLARSKRLTATRDSTLLGWRSGK